MHKKVSNKTIFQKWQNEEKYHLMVQTLREDKGKEQKELHKRQRKQLMGLY